MERTSHPNQRIAATRHIQQVIFVDTNVFMYAVGQPHPLRGRVLEFYVEATP